MTMSNKGIVLEVLKRAFIDRDPTVVDQYFSANYKQHSPVIPDGSSGHRWHDSDPHWPDL